MTKRAKKVVKKTPAKKKAQKLGVLGVRTLTKQVTPNRSTIEHQRGPWEYVEILSMFKGKCRCKVSLKLWTEGGEQEFCKDSISVWNNGQWNEVHSLVCPLPFEPEPEWPKGNTNDKRVMKLYYDALDKNKNARFQYIRDELVKVALKVLQSDYE